MLSGRNIGNTITAVGTAGWPEKTEKTEEQQESSGRPRRTGLRQSTSTWSGGRDHIPGYNEVDEMEDEEDAESSGADEYVGDDGDDDANEGSAAEDMSDDPPDMDDVDDASKQNQRLLVQLRYQKAVQNATETTPAGQGVGSSTQAATHLYKHPTSSVFNREAHHEQSALLDQPSTSKDVTNTIQPVSLGTELTNGSS